MSSHESIKYLWSTAGTVKSIQASAFETRCTNKHRIIIIGAKYRISIDLQVIRETPREFLQRLLLKLAV